MPYFNQNKMQNNNISGYTYGMVPDSPIGLQDLELLKKTVLFTDEDAVQLKKAGEILQDQTDAILDVWYGFVGANPHLLAYFSQNTVPDADYLAKVRARFGKWIEDVCNRPYDQQWLNYQHEIALRHHSTKKNKTDGASAAPIIHFRYMVGFIFPISVTIRPFLAAKGHSEAEVEKMAAAWFKAITLTVILWCYPYINKGEF